MYPAHSSRLLILITPYARGAVSNIYKYRYRQGAAGFCRRPVSMRDRLELSMGAGWRDQVTHALAETLVRAYRVKCTGEKRAKKRRAPSAGALGRKRVSLF